MPLIGHRHFLNYGASAGIQTLNPRIMSPVFYHCASGALHVMKMRRFFIIQNGFFKCGIIFSSISDENLGQYSQKQITLVIRPLSLTPLLSNLAVSTTNTVNLMFNSTKMAKATN